MSKAMDDLTGRRFGYLTVIERGKPARRHNGRFDSTFVCQCKCGNTITVKGITLKNGNTTSCGCKRRESVGAIKRTHGQSKTRLYRIWNKMKQRCYNPNMDDYNDYGARGITVCDEWINDYMAFSRWAYENGYNDTLTLDRVDVNGIYCPDNCRWATRKEQANNKRVTRYLTFNGVTKSVSEWSDMVGIHSKTILKRINLGWTTERALTTPVKPQKQQNT